VVVATPLNPPTPPDLVARDGPHTAVGLPEGDERAVEELRQVWYPSADDDVDDAEDRVKGGVAAQLQG
jgi:hypothetical protein